MDNRDLAASIDQLYQLPPNEFIGARNALAKSAGKNGTEVRALVKPSLPAWAVNQLYWKRRSDYDALAQASAALRGIHKAILAGRRGDIREATKAHDDAIERALKATLAILRDEGHPVTDATRQAIQTTLRALPGDEPAGRLTHALQPGGFEMLTGLSIAPVKQGKFAQKTEPAPGRRTGATSRDKSKEDHARQREEAKEAREAAAKRTRELRTAEHEAQREEFEAARTAREAEKAARTVERARESVDAAHKELEEAQRAAREAEHARDAARRRADSAAAAVARLRAY